MSKEQRPAAAVLIVDDEPSIRDMLASILGDAGYRVVQATTGRQAVEVATSERPDFIIVDINMPGITGLEFVRIIRSTAPPPLRDVPIAALTGMDLEAWREQAREAGCDAFLLKPISPEELIEVVRRYTT